MPEKGKRKVTATGKERAGVMLGLDVLGASVDYLLRVLGLKDFK